jgi:FkbM family methyltransferase|tara:strand:- start:290 stop:910 length:621 start_codon:yes stop_codon:yes gene_type:complete
MKVYFDIGATDGDFCLKWIKEKDVIVYAFEPQKELYEELYTKSLGYDNFFVYNVAVSDNKDKYNGVTSKQLFTYENYSVNSLFPFLKRDEYLEEEYVLKKIVWVETVRLDDFILKNNIDGVDFLKINTNGSEVSVLNSLGDLVERVKGVRTTSAIRSLRKIIPWPAGCKDDDICDWMSSNNFEMTENTVEKLLKWNSIDMIFVNKN